MPRKRQIDPEFFVDEEIAELSPYARLFYIGTWCHAEDTGILELKFNQLRVKIFPYEPDVDVESLYKELKDSGKLIEYSRNGKDYFMIKAFHKRQTIQHPSFSFLPMPPDPIRKEIPDFIRNKNKYRGPADESTNTHEGSRGLNEEYNRVELNRIEKNRIELNRNNNNSFSFSSDELKTLKMIFPKRSDEPALRIHLKNRDVPDDEIDHIIKVMFSGEKRYEMSEL